MNNLDMAVAQAAISHMGQFRRDNLTPFVLHPIRVMWRLLNVGIRDEDILCAAALHDTLEDTDLTPQEIQDSFGSRVLEFVSELTHDTEAMSRLDFLRTFETKSPQSCLIKLADKLDNISDSPSDPARCNLEAKVLITSVRSNKLNAPELAQALAALDEYLSSACGYPPEDGP